MCTYTKLSGFYALNCELKAWLVRIYQWRSGEEMPLLKK